MIYVAPLVVAAAVLGVGLYLMIAAHSVRRESDRTIQRLLAAHGSERASLLAYARDLNNRIMELAGVPHLEDVPRRELVVEDPWGEHTDPNVEGYVPTPNGEIDLEASVS